MILHDEFQNIAYLCDKLRQMLVFAHHIGAYANGKTMPMLSNDSSKSFQHRFDQLTSQMSDMYRHDRITPAQWPLGRGSRISTLHRNDRQRELFSNNILNTDRILAYSCRALIARRRVEYPLREHQRKYSSFIVLIFVSLFQ